MKTPVALVLAALMIPLAPAADAPASTLTFTGSYGNNEDVPETYGSNIAVDTAEFVTSDGTGATPNIALLWAPQFPGLSDAEFEFHSGAAFQRSFGAENVPIVQLDCNAGNDDPTITFTPDPGFAVAINSFDMGSADNSGPSDPYTWMITISPASDPEAPVFTKETLPHYRGDNSVEHVVLDFVGQVGVAYVMRFDDGGVDSYNSAIDNLSFSQVPEPSAMGLLTAALLGVAALRRRK
jgi:hypothetical protein